MTMIGYTMMCEQAGPKQLVRDVVLAEEAGFDFAVISDHYFPWLDSQGHAPYAWSVLGAAAQATDRIPLMTYVTCPIRRYHPAVVAQKAATMQLLSDGRFTLGLGAGENLNEHVVGGGWPIAAVRHEMLEEAVEIIRALWTGATVTYRGKHFDVESAKVWDLPDTAPPIGIAVSGPSSCRLAGRHADVMIAVEPNAELGRMFDEAGGSSKPRVGQIALSYDPDREGRREAGDGAVPLVHGRMEGKCRATTAGVVRSGVEDGTRGGRRREDAVRSRPREARRRDPPIRIGRLHPRRADPSRRGHPGAVHGLGGNRTSTCSPGFLTRVHSPQVMALCVRSVRDPKVCPR